MHLTERPALVVIDMQNGFCSPEGFMARLGLDTSSAHASIALIVDLARAARAAEIPVIWTRYVLLPDLSDAGLLLQSFPAIRGSGGLIAGSWDAALVDDLVPGPDELVIEKNRQSAFFGTEFEAQLQVLGVTELIVCGVTTNMCVESTVRDAYARDIRSVVIADASAAPSPELHQAALTSFRYGFGPDPLVSVAEVQQALRLISREGSR